MALSEDAIRESLRSLSAALREHGVAGAALYYSGQGDDGAIEDIELGPEGVELPDDVLDAIERWVFAVLPAGWAIDAGSRGLVEIDAARSQAVIEHETYTTEYVSYEIG